MANDWDRDAPQAPSSDNPFAPIDFTSRLQAAPKRAEGLHNAPPLRPGQLYGSQPWLAPPKPLVPPSAAVDGAPPAPRSDSSHFVTLHTTAPFSAPVEAPYVESAPASPQPDTLPPYLQRRPPLTPHRPPAPAPAAQRPVVRSTFAQPAAAAQDAPASVPFEDASATARRRRSRLVEHAAVEAPPAYPHWEPEPPQPEPPSAVQDESFAAEPFPPMPEPLEVEAPFADADNVIPFPNADVPWPSAAPAQGKPYWAEPDDAPAPSIPYAGAPDAQQPLTVDEIAAFFSDPAPDADVPPDAMEEPYYDPSASASFAPVADVPPQTPPDAPLRDAFEPVGAAPPAPKKDKPVKETPQRPARPPVRPLRVIALIGAFLMIVFCLVEGAYILRDLTQNEQQMEAAREEFRARTGQDLHSGAARVDLPPDGQTFSPTQTPAPTAAPPTPAPTSPANKTVFSRADTDAPQPSESSSTPALRTKATDYPNNPLRNVMESLQPLREENRDVVGHLVISGVVDEVVVHRNNIYYLTRNYRGTTSAAGAVFADESCSFRYPPENLLLRGQSAVAGKTFEPLLQFATAGREFVAAHTTAQLTTLYEEATYHLFAVIVADSDPTSSGYFNYASQPTFATDEDMLRYVDSARAHSLYQFSVDVLPSDRLLTLATVGKGSQCLVLLYRRER